MVFVTCFVIFHSVKRMKVFAKEDSLFIQFESVKPESKILLALLAGQSPDRHSPEH